MCTLHHKINDRFSQVYMTVQGAIDNSRSHLNEHKENLHYFTCLKKIISTQK